MAKTLTDMEYNKIMKDLPDFEIKRRLKISKTLKRKYASGERVSAKEKIRLSKIGKKRPDMTGEKNWNWGGGMPRCSSCNKQLGSYSAIQCRKCSVKRGEISNAWKGEDAGYSAKHAWIYSNYGKADHCSFDPSHTSHHFEWANISGSYLRDVNDWAQLCIKCHREYDMVRSGYSAFGRSMIRG